MIQIFCKKHCYSHLNNKKIIILLIPLFLLLESLRCFHLQRQLP